MSRRQKEGPTIETTYVKMVETFGKPVVSKEYVTWFVVDEQENIFTISAEENKVPQFDLPYTFLISPPQNSESFKRFHGWLQYRLGIIDSLQALVHFDYEDQDEEDSAKTKLKL